MRKAVIQGQELLNLMFFVAHFVVSDVQWRGYVKWMI
jgi:hypothetical protein